MTTLREAAQALVDEWDAAMAGDMPLNGHYQKQALDRLRAALAEQPAPRGAADAAFSPEALLRDLVAEVEYLCEDNGTSAILFEDFRAIVGERVRQKQWG